MICVSSASPPRGKFQEDDKDTTSALLCITTPGSKRRHDTCQVLREGLGDEGVEFPLHLLSESHLNKLPATSHLRPYISVFPSVIIPQMTLI